MIFKKFLTHIYIEATTNFWQIRPSIIIWQSLFSMQHILCSCQYVYQHEHNTIGQGVSPWQNVYNVYYYIIQHSSTEPVFDFKKSREKKEK